MPARDSQLVVIVMQPATVKCAHFVARDSRTYKIGFPLGNDPV